MPAKTRVAQLFSEMEGFGRPGAIPTVRNNPLDLRHSPHSSHVGIGPNDVGIIDTVEHGWEDGERQLELWASRGLTIRGAIEEQTGWTVEGGDVDGNNTEEFTAFVCTGLGLLQTMPLKTALLISAHPDVGERDSARECVVCGTEYISDELDWQYSRRLAVASHRKLPGADSAVMCPRCVNDCILLGFRFRECISNSAGLKRWILLIAAKWLFQMNLRLT